ncbi:hypothetical protein [Pseudodesulfovibrio senegalensis]|jgi:hypothetical protein|uniref:Uncharacterized protein n=1 Tax=Pseudodesulfovibrio senegalensis TaxID=1721087 RepID=A0A6N6N392_9BACT|nr:hypothetical protein [Pseudodesulfovibrio senegalensis]KAB1441855.1 hypothetical protein F8A88_09725 [Pseudodesulfovibrio senegalensis]
MKSRLIVNSILLAIAASLSGCLALSALFGAGSFLLNGPAQYIGTVYAVGEYTYEYAANGKSPVTVVAEKLDRLDNWLNPHDHAAEPRVMLARAHVHDTTTIPGSPQSAVLRPMAAVSPAPLRMNPARENRSLSEPLHTSLAANSPRPPHGMKKQTKPKAMPVTPPVAPTIFRSDTVDAPMTVLASASAPPRSLRHLQRMELAFAHADAAHYAERDPATLRISVSSDTRGISGSWRIRHRVSRPDLS